MTSEVVENFAQMTSEGLERAEQGFPPAAIVSGVSRAVQPDSGPDNSAATKGLEVLLDILEVVVECLGVVRLALVHRQDDSPPCPSRPSNQLLEHHSAAPVGALALGVVQEQTAAVVPRSENRQLVVLAWGRPGLLSAPAHPGPRQMRMQVSLGLVDTRV